MTFDAHSNFAYSTVAGAPSPATTGTSLTVAAGTGIRFPAAPFNAVIWPTSSVPTPSNAEVVRVTNIATDTFTISRKQESSTARTVVAGDQIMAAVTAKTLTDIETGIPTTKTIEETAAKVAAKEGLEESAYAVSTANVASKKGEPTADGVTVPAGKIILLTAQSTPAENGPWVAQSGTTAWTRPASFAHGQEVYGTYVPVTEGTTYKGSIWLLSSKTVVVVDTTNQAWVVNSAGSGSGVFTAAELEAKLGEATGGSWKNVGIFSTMPTVLKTGGSGHYPGQEGFENLCVGTGTMALTTGAFNTFIGLGSGVKVINGRANVLIGGEAGANLGFAEYVEAIGGNTLRNVKCAVGDLYLGVSAGEFYQGNFTKATREKLEKAETFPAEVESEFGYNLVIGSNSHVGTEAVPSSGQKNTILGHRVAQALTGNYNVVVGFEAAKVLSTGASNLIAGRTAGYELKFGNENTIVGNLAGFKYQGDRSILIGMEAGKELSVPSAVTSETAIAGKKIKMTGSEGKGFVNNAQVCITALTAGVTGLAVGVRYYVVGAAASEFELAATEGGAGIAVATHKIETNTEMAVLHSNRLVIHNNYNAEAAIEGQFFSTFGSAGIETLRFNAEKLGFFKHAPAARKTITAEASAKALIEYLKEIGLCG